VRPIRGRGPSRIVLHFIHRGGQAGQVFKSHGHAIE
jgi:hypothetical protein